ncbi:MAG: T9SS type A sorting domain-containing protein [Ignavibacteriales bacterium]|nr:T9SS type A sorting domain-containing protein [Ignavibacteriales bacterium]
MKKFIQLLIAVLFYLPAVSWGQIFSQNFTSSSTLSDYINSTSPNSGQWNAIGSSNANGTVLISNNALVFTRTTDPNSMSFSRTTDFSPTPTGMVYSFVIAVSGNTVAQTTAAVFQVGSVFGTANSAEANANVYARFGINLTATDGTFSIRDIGAGTNSATLSGAQSITWYLNNTGSTVTYTGPDGSSEAVANDTWDLWAGTAKIMNDKAATTVSQSMTDLKFAFTAGTGAIILDNFLIYGATDGALPVELTSFTSNVNGNKVELNWKTATEVNNYGFSIERLAVSGQPNADSWTKIGFVQGNGNSNSPKSYSFTDEPTGGKEFNYRLKQIDFDGAYEYSDIITAVLENVSAFALEQNFPNPFNPTTKISYTIPERVNVKLKIYDMIAQQVAELVNGSQEAGHYQVTFDGSDLPSGVYFYKLEAGKFVEVKKFMLIK